LGGLGPLAGAHFYRRLIELTVANGDADHLSVVLISEPGIPSRRDFLRGQGVSPVPALQQVARDLETMGCDLIAVPSTTTHAFYSDIASAVHAPILNMPIEVKRSLLGIGIRRPAMIATRATREARIYEPHFQEDIKPLYPPPSVQDQIELLIDAVKQGKDISAIRDDMDQVVREPWLKEADGILLACTETPLIAPANPNRSVVSATDVLAFAALRHLRPMQTQTG
jgi:aspartate racemase